jgi:integrase/recombinase XerD
VTKQVPTQTNLELERSARLIWPLSIWPVSDRTVWVSARLGASPHGRDSPSLSWSERTLKKNEDGYGRYLSWLHREGLLNEDDPIGDRITPKRLAAYVACLKAIVAPVSVATTVGALTSAAKTLSPDSDWSWLSRRSTRLKLRAKPSRDKRRAMQHTLTLYRFGLQVMEKANQSKSKNVPAAQRYQSGLIIALLAARPLRIRNFQAITIGTSLRWDGSRYWLTFNAEDTKTRSTIDEPVPDDLAPYLEAFLRTWRPILIRRASKFSGAVAHRRLWVDRYGAPMKENTLRELIKRYTRNHFGRAVWPHLFRDCLFTSVAEDQPDLMTISATLLGHVTSATGQAHYNHARMVEASRRYGRAIWELRESFLMTPRPEDGEAGPPVQRP